jgi:integrase
MEAKNLAKAEPLKSGRAGATEKKDVKGKLVEFLWYLKKQSLSEKTVNLRGWLLKRLVDAGGNLFDSESMKATIRKIETWNNSTKRLAVQAYTSFLAMLGLRWQKPRYREREKLPFIPLEKEIDVLINGCGRVMGTFLQALKDTGADPGELIPITWTDINFQSKTVSINHPVKGHKARIRPVSDEFLRRLKTHPKRPNGRLFSNYPTMHGSFQQQRRRLAHKLGNPRLLKIAFTTLRHWKATMEYHKTHDVYHVKKLLGHKRLQSTEIYINLEQALFKQENDGFHVKAVKTLDEACKLIEVGFEYVTDVDCYKVFRKRK